MKKIVESPTPDLRMMIKNEITRGSQRQRSIREARDNSRWSAFSQPNLFSLDRFLRKSGYRLEDVLVHNGKLEVIINPQKPGYLYPEITQDTSDNLFYIHLEKTGEYIVSDVEEIIKGYNNAVSVAKYLDSLDLSKLEIED